MSFGAAGAVGNASTNGSNLLAIGGGNATIDDFFKSVKIPVWGEAIKALEDKKVGSAMLKKYRKRVMLFSLWENQPLLCSILN